MSVGAERRTCTTNVGKRWPEREMVGGAGRLPEMWLHEFSPGRVQLVEHEVHGREWQPGQVPLQLHVIGQVGAHLQGNRMCKSRVCTQIEGTNRGLRAWVSVSHCCARGLPSPW